MSLDTNESLRDLTDSFLCKPIGRAMMNPLTLAFMLTIIIMVIIIYTYDRNHTFRTLLRVFSINIFFLFLSQHILMEDMNCKQLNSDQRDILKYVEKTNTSMGESIVVPTKPKLDTEVGEAN